MYDIDSIKKIGKHCIHNGLTLAIAESVTSGHLQAAFSNADQAALFLQGGITVYNIGQKARHLQIDPIHALQCNAVSGKIARQLALGATNMFSSDIGIGITGYASPLPEKNVYDLHAFFCIVCKEKVVAVEKINVDGKDSFANQVFYTNAVVEACINVIDELI